MGEHPDPTIAQSDDVSITKDGKKTQYESTDGVKIWQYTWSNFFEISMAFAKALHAM